MKSVKKFLLAIFASFMIVSSAQGDSLKFNESSESFEYGETFDLGESNKPLESPKSSESNESLEIFKTPPKIINNGEISGFIFGLGAIYSPFRFTQYSERQITTIRNTGTGSSGATTTTTITPLSSISANGYGVSGNIVVGYQGFLEPFSEVVQFGLRVYGDLNATKTHIKNDDKIYVPTMLRYGINFDMMMNFIIMERFFGLGLFAGVRIGGVSYFGKDIDEIDRALREFDGAFPKGSFDLGINVGIRANIARNSGVEFIFALPVFKTDYKANKDSVRKTNNSTTTTTNRINGTLQEKWSVGLRYIWTFD